MATSSWPTLPVARRVRMPTSPVPTLSLRVWSKRVPVVSPAALLTVTPLRELSSLPRRRPPAAQAVVVSLMSHSARSVANRSRSVEYDQFWP